MEPVLRVVDDPVAGSAGMPRYSHNAYPVDVIHMSQGSTVQEFKEKWERNVAEAVADGLRDMELNPDSEDEDSL